MANKQIQHTPRSQGKLNLLVNKIRANFESNETFGGFLKSAFFYLSKKNIPFKFVSLARLMARKVYLLIENKKIIIINGKDLSLVHSKSPYAFWLAKNIPGPHQFKSIKDEMKLFSSFPIFDITLFANKPDESILHSIQSLHEQLYPHWKLSIITRSSEIHESLRTLIKNRSFDIDKIRFDVISSVQPAVSETGTTFVLDMAPGDCLTVDALFQFAKSSLINPKAGVLYADEDEIGEDGTLLNPYFKPDWSPDNLLSFNYIKRAVVFRKDVLAGINGWAEKWKNDEHFDVLLRATELSNQVEHISHILYHAVPRTPSREKDKAALTETMLRRNENGSIVESDIVEGIFIPRYTLKEEAKVSIVIPTKDKIDILKVCIESIVQTSTYKNYEIVLIDNNSSTPEFFNQVKTWEQSLDGLFKCIRTEHPFNFAYLMNFGASHCSGEYYILLNNDTEVITPNWMELMMEQAQRDSIGIAGAKLLYPNNTVQHAGVVIGLSGLVDHVFVGIPRDGKTYQNYLHRVINYSALTAACFMVSRDKFNQVKGFDERFAVEYNDVDFCLRLKEAGYNHVYLPHVELYHHESISRGHPFSNKASYERHLREFALMQNTWQKYVNNDPCYNLNLSLKDRNMGVAY